MGEQIGEKLPTLERGDSVVITAGENKYEGTVIKKKRKKCELNMGFMEAGSISVYFELCNKTIKRHDISTKLLVISATEEVPYNWSVPQASIFSPSGDETTNHLGKVTALERSQKSPDYV